MYKMMVFDKIDNRIMMGFFVLKLQLRLLVNLRFK